MLLPSFTNQLKQNNNKTHMSPVKSNFQDVQRKIDHIQCRTRAFFQSGRIHDLSEKNSTLPVGSIWSGNHKMSKISHNWSKEENAPFTGKNLPHRISKTEEQIWSWRCLLFVKNWKGNKRRSWICQQWIRKHGNKYLTTTDDFWDLIQEKRHSYQSIHYGVAEPGTLIAEGMSIWKFRSRFIP